GELLAAEAGERARIEMAFDCDTAVGTLKAPQHHGAIAAWAGTYKAGHSLSPALAHRAGVRKAIFLDVGVGTARPAFDGCGGAADAGGDRGDHSGGGRSVPIANAAGGCHPA